MVLSIFLMLLSYLISSNITQPLNFASCISILTDKPSSKQKYRLEKIINPEEKSEKTLLFWLREIPGHSSPESFIKVIQKQDFILTQ